MNISTEDAARHVARMKRFEEDVAAARSMNIEQGYMQCSVLSASTRKSHADRHGKLFTAAQIREFWSAPENVAGCKCIVLPVMLGHDGQPVVPALIENARKTYEVMAARGYAWAK